MQPYILNCIIIIILAACTLLCRGGRVLNIGPFGAAFTALSILCLGAFEYSPCPEIGFNAAAALTPVMAAFLPCEKERSPDVYSFLILLVMSGAASALTELFGGFAHLFVGAAAALAVFVSGARGGHAMFGVTAVPVMGAVLKSVYDFAFGGYAVLDITSPDILGAQSASMIFMFVLAGAAGLMEARRRA